MTNIKLLNITKVYPSPAGPVRAVDDVSLDIAPGEFFFLLGPSGCGKTTLLRMIAGLVEPSAGQIFFGEQDVTALPVEKRSAAMVFQNYALWPHMTVTQNVEFGPKMKGLPAGQRREIAQASLARVQMEDFGKRKPTQLSGGQQQRIALARALAAQGHCLLLDEPLSNLDARLRLHMRGQLRQLVKDTGVTAVYVTHDQKEALSMADRVAVMDAGRIVQVAPPQELYSRPATRFVADFLGEANFATGKVTTAEKSAGRIDSPVGQIVVTGKPVPKAGTTVTVCIRPEHLTLTASSEFGVRSSEQDSQSKSAPPNSELSSSLSLRAEGRTPNSLPARVVSSTYLGELRQYVCLMADGSQWRVSLLADSNPPLPANAEVTLRADGDNVVILCD